MSQQTVPLSRSLPTSEGQFLYQEQIVNIPWMDFHTQYGVSGVIRVPKKDFPLIPTSGPFTHFNLEVSYHRTESVYLIIAIIQPGWYRANEEVLPLLDPELSVRAKCLSVKEFVPYSLLQEADFRYSLPQIQTVDDLKREMIQRYRQSLPELSDEQILERGVSVTTLEILEQ